MALKEIPVTSVVLHLGKWSFTVWKKNYLTYLGNKVYIFPGET